MILMCLTMHMWHLRLSFITWQATVHDYMVFICCAWVEVIGGIRAPKKYTSLQPTFDAH